MMHILYIILIYTIHYTPLYTGKFCKIHDPNNLEAIANYGCYHESSNRPEIIKYSRGISHRGVYPRKRKISANLIVTFVDDYTIDQKTFAAIPFEGQGFGYFFNASDTPNCTLVNWKGRLCIQVNDKEIDEKEELTVSHDDKQAIIAACKQTSLAAQSLSVLSEGGVEGPIAIHSSPSSTTAHTSIPTATFPTGSGDAVVMGESGQLAELSPVAYRISKAGPKTKRAKTAAIVSPEPTSHSSSSSTAAAEGAPVTGEMVTDATAPKTLKAKQTRVKAVKTSTIAASTTTDTLSFVSPAPVAVEPIDPAAATTTTATDEAPKAAIKHKQPKLKAKQAHAAEIASSAAASATPAQDTETATDPTADPALTPAVAIKHPKPGKRRMSQIAPPTIEPAVGETPMEGLQKRPRRTARGTGPEDPDGNSCIMS